MKRVIRQGSFETNSSSMHSICKMTNIVEDKDFYQGIYVDRDGEWDLSGHDDELNFGRYPFRILTTPGDKARYAIASLVYEKGDDAYQQIFEAVKSIEPELKDIRFDIDTHDARCDDREMDHVRKWYGDKYLVFDNNIIYYEHDLGWVDDNILGPFLKKYDISIKQFITDDHIIVVCDGDEYLNFSQARASGLINEKNIEIEYPNRKKDGWWEEIYKADENQG